VGKKPTPLVDDAGNMRFTCKKGGVLPADLGKQKNLDTTTGLKINKKYFFLKIRKGYIVFLTCNLANIWIREILDEERSMRGKILVLLVCIAMLVGVLSGCTETKKETTATNHAPMADFDYDVADKTVTFTDKSTDEDDDTLTYSWDFGDDIGNSTLQNPEYTYAGNDTYTVKLTVSDGTEEDSMEDTIIVGNIAPTAGFTYVADGLNVTFTDASTDPNTDDTLTYSWDFDSDDTAENTTEGPVTYEYAAAGTYNATLTVTDSYGLTDSYIEEITVTA
jgi:hypothetical protein